MEVALPADSRRHLGQVERGLGPKTETMQTLTDSALPRTHGTFGPQELSWLLGIPSQELTPASLSALEQAPLGFRVTGGFDRERLLLEALEKANSDMLSRTGPERIEAWERGWGENLERFATGGEHLGDLIPRYNHYRVLRLLGEYIRVDDAAFEYTVYSALRRQLFARYFDGLEHVTEFGCGTGTSLLDLAGLYSGLQLRGCDWAKSSQTLLSRIAAKTDRAIEGRRFDMFEPDEDLRLEHGCGVFTSAALEQIGTRHERFLEYLLQQDASVYLHIEPLVELYDERKLFDRVAAHYHRRRGYLEGFLPRLQQLEREGAIEILELSRTGFGSFFHEGYSVVAWRKR